jgi:subtilisin family serine protease
MNKQRIFVILLALVLLSACQPTGEHTPTPSTDNNAAVATSTRTLLTDAILSIPTNTLDSTQWQWYLDHIHASPIQNQTIPSVRVAIIDTGIDTTHPDLVDQIIETIDVFAEPAMYDRQGHGTHTAGIIAAKPNSIMQTRGICVTCQIIAIKAINDDGYGSDVTVAQGIDDAIKAGAQVINLSVGSGNDAPVIKAAVERALAADIIVVAAAGNTTKSSVEAVFPAAYPGVLAVSAVDKDNRTAPFAQSNPSIDIVAPGVDILSTSPFGERYSIEQGTSTAAPQVTATVALVRALRPELTAQQTRELILVHTVDLGEPGYDTTYGHGLLHVDNVIKAAQQPDVTQRGQIRGRIIGADPRAVTLELNKQPIPLDPNAQFRRTNLAAGTHTLEIIYDNKRIPVTFNTTGIGLFVTDINIWIRNGIVNPEVTEQLP